MGRLLGLGQLWGVGQLWGGRSVVGVCPDPSIMSTLGQKGVRYSENFSYWQHALL